MNFKEHIAFFDSIDIKVEDVTSEQEKLNHQKAVVVTYRWEDKQFTTKRLFYKRIIFADSIRDASGIEEYFEKEVYWLDIDTHEWPKPKGETDINDLIINDITDDSEFKEFLLLLANNDSTGHIQKITKAGRSAQYYRKIGRA